MKKTTWETRKNKEYWGKRNIDAEGFIHCSTIEYFWRVAPNFADVEEELVLIGIDENKLEADLKQEDGDNCGREYPHIYGMINNDAVVTVLTFIKYKDGVWQKNPEFSDIQYK